MSVSHAAYEAMVEHLADRDETIVRLNAELEDVCQQRETLKAECAALSEEVKILVKDYGMLQDNLYTLACEAKEDRAEVERAKSWSDAVTEQADKLVAEVERRGEMLKRCAQWMGIAALQNEKAATLIFEIDEIESLDNAPDPSNG